MVLKIRAKITRSPNSHTQYIAIPSAMTQDSQYPFSHGDEVEIVVDPEEKKLEVKLPERITVQAGQNRKESEDRVRQHGTGP